ncbi:S-adenosyl-L-methionine-dependent methyltransferase [Ilyonectria robusta]|uniref:S-adenosyl-L-methionine-dependent methyltransferase n=1 Tax=Ilyonectria robusta TaxID=1079257 RepID=UPI001E8CDFD1|nr:S-adenosyl-L-methionine-dependent methyltransferase [Ilyonectria robusta]KAH8675149.1 S-adenosyl-L-methionine-dependent methyltransferase [Ilyonectria robusta]
MARVNGNAHLTADIDFIQTPPPPQDALGTGKDCGVRVTDSPAIKNAPLPADGAGYEQFSNATLATGLLGIPTWLSWQFGGGFKLTMFFGLFTTVPVLLVIWTFFSTVSPRLNDKVKLPGRPVEYYLKFKKPRHQARWNGRHKIPMQTFFEMYFEGEVDINGDLLEVFEYRHEWATFNFTLDLFRYIFFTFAPDVILHHRSQDEDQVRPNYDRGNDHYAWFLGPRMIYTSGIISDPTREETLEEMQDNKMAVVCEKIGLKEGETMLDIGCGWGTLAKFASVNYGARVTGVTLARNQTAWGNDALKNAGIPEEQSRILCSDYRDIPETKFDKITQLEMAEHVGVRRLTGFFRQCYEMLEDDGSMYVQLSGLRKSWQYEDFIWGLFLNKYIFPGADASTPLSYYVGCLESAGFEIKSVDTIGVHYSGTLWRWYRNWLGNADEIIGTYGTRWFRIWELFLAYSTIASRQGSATCFQIVVVKNLNSTHRVDGISSQFGLTGALEASKAGRRAAYPVLKA